MEILGSAFHSRLNVGNSCQNIAYYKTQTQFSGLVNNKKKKKKCGKYSHNAGIVHLILKMYIFTVVAN